MCTSNEHLDKCSHYSVGPTMTSMPTASCHDIDIHHGECMLQNHCFVDNIKLRRHIFIGLSLFGFDFVLMFCISLAFQVWLAHVRLGHSHSACC